MRQYFKFIAIAVGGISATKANEYLVGNGINIYISLFLSAIVAVIVNKLLEYIFIEMPLKVYNLRLLFNANAAFEGHWIQTINKNNKRFYSYINISYNEKEKKYHISGEAIDIKGNMHSSFKSMYLHMDAQRGKLFYYYQAEMYDGSGETIYGYGIINFFEIINKQYHSGKGYFIDSGRKLIRSYYSIDRITNKEVEEMIGKSKIFTTEGKRKLIKKYDEKYKNERAISIIN